MGSGARRFVGFGLGARADDFEAAFAVAANLGTVTR
jgi:hypothetical protein